MSWKDVARRGIHLGTCKAEFRPFEDGECYTCMFYLDDCHYLVRSSEQTANEVKG